MTSASRERDPLAGGPGGRPAPSRCRKPRLPPLAESNDPTTDAAPAALYRARLGTLHREAEHLLSVLREPGLTKARRLKYADAMAQTLQQCDPGQAERADVPRDALASVLAYCWEDEQADARDAYRESGTLAGHVFVDLVQLDNWLHGTDRKPEDYPEDEP
jgi:hypothetical protein